MENITVVVLCLYLYGTVGWKAAHETWLCHRNVSTRSTLPTYNISSRSWQSGLQGTVLLFHYIGGASLRRKQ